MANKRAISCSVLNLIFFIANFQTIRSVVLIYTAYWLNVYHYNVTTFIVSYLCHAN